MTFVMMPAGKISSTLAWRCAMPYRDLFGPRRRLFRSRAAQCM
jgi:hypothetical protein